MTDTKPTKDQIEANPTRYRVLDGGAVYDNVAGHIVAHLGGPYQITKSNARQMQKRGRLTGLRSILKGLVDAAKEKGAELPDPDSMTDEELEQAGGDAIRLITKHTALTYLDSKNLRGMGEVFPKLIQPLTSLAEDEDVPYPVMRNIVYELANLARQVQQKAINGDIIDITPE